MGLHSREHASHQHPVVLNPQLACHRALPLWHGGNDPLEDPAQRHRKVLTTTRLLSWSEYLYEMFVLRYNQIDSGEDAQEEFGWKLVHGDVFRYIEP